MKPAKNITEAHFQHNVWMNELEFYKEELKIFRNRLKEITSKNSARDCQISIKNFRNKFSIHESELDEIEQLIHKNTDEVVKKGLHHIKRLDYEATEGFRRISEMVELFRKLYRKLKRDFFIFLTKWM